MMRCGYCGNLILEEWDSDGELAHAEHHCPVTHEVYEIDIEAMYNLNNITVVRDGIIVYETTVTDDKLNHCVEIL